MNKWICLECGVNEIVNDEYGLCGECIGKMADKANEQYSRKEEVNQLPTHSIQTKR